MTRALRLVIVATFVALPAHVAAAAAPPGSPTVVDLPVPVVPLSFSDSARIDPGLRRHFFLRGHTGGPVVVRFNAPLDDARLRSLEARGVTFERSRGEVLHVGPFYGVHVDASAWPHLLEAPDVERILPPAPPIVRPSPLESRFGGVHELTEAKPLWPVRDPDGRPLTGAGVTLVDIDGPMDLFHPLFFRPDAGLYAFVDVNDDGVLTPGVDGVDLDGDGEIGPHEVLHALGGDVLDARTRRVIDAATPFDPARQWLYLDENGNGRRDFGPAGFTEATPAYGEPLFLADDVDRDGSVVAGEKLLRLGTSKVKGIFRMASSEAYLRGENLIETPQNPDDFHGTGVAGILVGGEYGRTLVHGVAPDADLLHVDQGFLPHESQGDFDATHVAALAWAEQEGAQVFVHEYGSPVHQFADGASEWEQVLDALSDEGSAQLTATHNFADTAGNADVTLPAEGTLDVPLRVLGSGQTGYVLSYLSVTLRWRDADATLLATLVTPDGAEIPLAGNFSAGGHFAMASTTFSSRGTGLLSGMYTRMSGNQLAPLLAGSWTLRLENTAPRAVDARVHVSDETSYSVATVLEVETTRLGTIAFPATADSAISVGASVGNTVLPNEVPLGLKAFSGRGPRIDGELSIDVVAPEDHYTAAGVSHAGVPGGYMAFAGTSGALPLVAGAVALLLQKEPGLTPAEVKARIQQSSVRDELTGPEENVHWGWGRLSTYRLVMGEAPPENTPPVPVLEVPLEVFVGEPVTLDASGTHDVDEPATGLTYRFDVGYDGVFDMEGADATPSVTFEVPGRVSIKLLVQDSVGATRELLVALDVLSAPEPPSCGCRAGSADPGTASLMGLGLLGLVLVRARRRASVERPAAP